MKTVKSEAILPVTMCNVQFPERFARGNIPGRATPSLPGEAGTEGGSGRPQMRSISVRRVTDREFSGAPARRGRYSGAFAYPRDGCLLVSLLKLALVT